MANEVNNEDRHENYNVLPPHLAVQAMRDSGYRNTAYAVAELIDNAVQAGASKIQIVCCEDTEVVQTRRRARLTKIGVIDDGSGMPGDVLRSALQFGNGRYLNDRSGIGRFGMGLPNSSISQAKRVDVWTWTDGIEGAIHSYLDVREVQQGRLVEVPQPRLADVDELWKEIWGRENLKKSGTLVVWSEIDRCTWKTANALLNNAEALIGRIYRRFLDGKELGRRLTIEMVVVRDGRVESRQLVRPNDPLYLMRNTSCPAPWDEEPMFEAVGDPIEIEAQAPDGGIHVVRITFSAAKQKAREKDLAGAAAHGKHAKKNIGVSIMRADRELEVQKGWANDDPTERWWGCEVDIPPALDEVFGVSNNKQSAVALAELAKKDLEELVREEGFDSVQQMQEAWLEEGDLRYVLVHVARTISEELNRIRNRLRERQAGVRSRQRRQRHPEGGRAEIIGTQATRERQRRGSRGDSDEQEDAPEAQRIQELTQKFMEEDGLDSEDAAERAEAIVRTRRKYEFVPVDVGTSAFFTVRPRGGALLVQLNVGHPAYKHLMAMLERSPEDLEEGDAVEVIQKAYDGLKLLLEAWARFEDETPGERKRFLQDAREDWGRVARDFFRDD